MADDTIPHHYTLDIVSLQGRIWQGRVHQARFPGLGGSFGIMARHLPMFAILAEGLIHVEPVEGEALDVYVSGGYVEVQPQRVLVMADLAERNDDADAARAHAAREAAASPIASGFTDPAYLHMHAELVQRYGLRGRRR